MAIRNIREEGDEILRKRSREVEVIDDKLATFVNDMAETMYEAHGIGLAAPQVGILKRVVVIDIGEGLIELINPRIISQSGEQSEMEGCLSIPEIVGEVKRPLKIVVEARNLKGKEFVIEGEGLLARALSHEIDHLDGILFIDKAVNLIDKSETNKDSKI